MALPAYALVTLDEVKTHLGVSDAERDEILEGLVAEVSRSVLDMTGREFAPATASGVTRIVGARRGSSLVDLFPYEARAVTAVTVALGETYEQVLSVGDWQLAPLTSPDGVYQYLELSAPLPVGGKFRTVPVSITGTWGWASVPTDVKGWTLEMVEDRWKADHATYSDAMGNVMPGSSGPVTIPYRIVAEMEAVRRARIGSV
jgi:hypothetical protein